MGQSRSIRFRLSAVFFFFFLLVTVLGLFSIGRLTDFNRVSADIRDRWLPNTRLLGDLNNYTSDFRAAEGSRLLSSSPAEIAASDLEIAELDKSIAQAQAGYERIRHDADEAELYARFAANWEGYRAIVRKMMELSTAYRVDAIAMYRTTSRQAYNAASDALGHLTDRNVADAREANARAESTYEQARWLIRIAMAVAAVMVVGALFYVRRSVSRPLLDLATRMHRLADNDTGIDIHGIGRRDEIGEMARAVVVFRKNAIELMVSQQTLAQQATMLEEKLAHEQHLTQLQRNFVSMASHEFHTPLTIIDGHAQRLIKMTDRLRTEEIVERARKVRAAVLRMTNLINNLLHSSRLVDSGAGLYFHPADIDVAALLHDVCRLHREITPGSQIWENFGSAPLRATGDSKLLFQVFSNLLSNAVKYSPNNSLIKISAAMEAGEIAIIVQDHGIGVPKEDIPGLFTRYYRGRNVSGIVGTGVGLYLVKMVVELHGGTVAVDSQEGKGSRFTVRLPAASAVPADGVSTLAPTSTDRLAAGEHQADAERAVGGH